MTTFTQWQDPSGGPAVAQDVASDKLEENRIASASPPPSNLKKFGDFVSRTIAKLAQLGPGHVTVFVAGEPSQLVAEVPVGVTHLVSAVYTASIETKAGKHSEEKAIKVTVQDGEAVIAGIELEANVKAGDTVTFAPVEGKTVKPGDPITLISVAEKEAPSSFLHEGLITLQFA